MTSAKWRSTSMSNTTTPASDIPNMTLCNSLIVCVTGSTASTVRLPDCSITSCILDWLTGYPQMRTALLYVLAGQYEHADVPGELVIKADQASVTQALGGDPVRAMAAPKHALQRKLLDGLHYLLREEPRLNQDGTGDG